jgi:hypothetical protein
MTYSYVIEVTISLYQGETFMLVTLLLFQRSNVTK